VSNEPSWDDIFSSQPGAAPREQANASGSMTRRELREAEERAAARPGKKRSLYDTDGGATPPKKKKRRLGWLWALLVVVVVGAGGAFAAWTLFEPQIREVLGWQLPTDYEGSGNGTEVEVVVKAGDFGLDIAKTLSAAGVTMTTDAFYQLLLPMSPQPNFLPGTYTLQKEMSAQSAFDALQNPDNRVVSHVLIREGVKLSSTLQALADGTGVSLEEFETAAADLASFGVPAEAPSLEGYLFPATYTFDPGISAHDILAQMVARCFQSLDAQGVAVDDRHRVLTLAALIQKEGGSAEDFYKVSRVFTNRITIGMLLQSDATVSYGSGGTSISTTAAERADASNLYNTYVHPGLPIGPIGAPGDDAIDAALHPVDGPWLYFVLINGETGETTFSETLAQHNAAVKVWQAWLRDHPDFDN
jgi:UPF0755 protein